VIIHLSHALFPGSPLYPNTPPPVVSPHKSIRRGDSANASTVTYSTHTGTHVDAPCHFCEGSGSIEDFFKEPVSLFPVQCIDLHLHESREIGIADLETGISRVRDAEAILLRTGWHTVRSTDPGRYSADHPWVSPDLPQFLKENCPRLRLFGLDQISVSSPLHREAGHACHRNFLCGDRPILLLEDIDLSDRRLKNPFRIHLFPHFIDRIDAVPVTVIAEL
jgi:arylformamidase